MSTVDDLMTHLKFALMHGADEKSFRAAIERYGQEQRESERARIMANLRDPEKVRASIDRGEIATEAYGQEREQAGYERGRTEREQGAEPVAWTQRKRLALFNPDIPIVCWQFESSSFDMPLYASPPKRKPLTDEQSDERAWLVEWRYNGTQWLYLTGGSFNFTSDPNKALRFARRDDAEVAMAWAIEVDRRRGLRPTGELLVAEHEWIERAHGIGDE